MRILCVQAMPLNMIIFNPQDLQSSLETRCLNGLFFAGQINGTTGYEEAGAQGLLAGLNAGLRAQEKESWCPRRDEAYIGVLVDDLITLGTQEPYRMFTSRAEYRLLLREDNADSRLTEKAREFGLVDDIRWKAFNEKCDAVRVEKKRLETTWVQAKSPEADVLAKKIKTPLTHEYNLMDLLKRPELNYADVGNLFPAENPVPQQVSDQIEIGVKYAGYIHRQEEDIQRLRQHEETTIPESFDYSSVEGLSNEIKQKLIHAKPESLGRAARIPGVTPSAISLLLIYLKKRGLLKKNKASTSPLQENINT